MIIPTKKLKNGFEIPVFGLGTWLFGGSKVRDPLNDDKNQIEAIKRAVEHGVTHIDVAENYAEGYAEELVGKAVKSLDRKKLFLTTKVDKMHLRHDDVLSACKASLKRLQTDYLDLYLIHAPNDEVSLSETMKAMDILIAEGLIKNIGVSNFCTKRFIEAQKCTQNKLVINQVYYNLTNREPENDLLIYCQNNDVILEAYRPLNKGMLLENSVRIVQELCKKYQKTFAQLALNWLVSQKNVITISRATSQEHLEEDLASLDWAMSEEDIETLRLQFPNQISEPKDLPLR